MRTIGFIGLGAMGAPMARNLLDAGYELNVYDLSPGRVDRLEEAGATGQDAPRAVADRSDAVIIMVPDGDAVLDVITGDDGVAAGLSASDYVLQMSTIGRDATAEAADAVREVGGRYVDAPVSGTVGPAEDGTLTILAGGKEEYVESVEPVLSAMGEPIVRCGEVGDGTAMKLFVNLLLGDMMQAFAEALVFGSEHGLSIDDMLTVVESGAVDSPLFRAKGRRIREDDFDADFPVDYLFKDLSLALDAAGDEEVPLPVTATARDAVNAARAVGTGEEDMAAIIRALEKLTGTAVGGGMDPR